MSRLYRDTADEKEKNKLKLAQLCPYISDSFHFFTLFLTDTLEKCQTKSFKNVNTLLSAILKFCTTNQLFKAKFLTEDLLYFSHQYADADHKSHATAGHAISPVVVTRPLPKDGSMAEDHGAPEIEQLPRAWTRGRKVTESCQIGSEQKVYSWTVQNEMRGVLGRVSTGAAGRILDSVNSRKIGA